MKITEDVRAYAASRGLSEGEAVQRGLAEKAAEFQEGGEALYHAAP
jgi:phosphomethylpyrimidine synthase